jgi:mono/diheme cytochrome c family protein
MWRPDDCVRAMIAFSGALVIANDSVLAAGDPVAWKDIASRRCAQCHLVNGGRTRSVAPPLPVIARDVSWTDDRLADFLTKSHGGMRGFSLSRQEIEHLVAYMRSLQHPVGQ